MGHKDMLDEELEVNRLAETAPDQPKAPEDMTIQELRKFAALARIPVANTMTKQDIIKAIADKKKTTNKDIATLAEHNGAHPMPGYSRIELHPNTREGESNRPVFFGCNGYNITIPRGIPVDVPTKVLSVIRDTTSTKKVETEEGSGKWKDITTMTYPFNHIETTPGPDPRPGYEVGKMATHGPRADFHEKFGYWPTKEGLREAQKHGFVIIKPPVKVN